MKRKLLSTLIASLGLAGAGLANAQISGNVVKIGVLNDMSGLYADLSGMGSVTAAKMAVDDYLKASKSALKVEVVSADHQNKPDVGSSIVRKWYDTDGVDAVFDVPTSSVALAVSQISREKGKALINSGAGTADLTGKDCSPNTVHWLYDTWMLAHGTGSAVVKSGGDSWFFLTADYAFGHALERDTAAVVKASGGKILGSVKVPLATQDFSSFCCKHSRPRPRSSAWPMRAATPSTPSNRRPNSASPRAARSWRACWCSCPTCMAWAWTRRRA